MRYIRLAFLAVLAVVLVVLALANRGVVVLHLLPGEMAAFVPFPTELALPLFVVVFGGIVAGLLIGFFWEWLREHKHRAEASHQKREAARLSREVKTLRTKAGDASEDDVLALLE